MIDAFFAYQTHDANSKHITICNLTWFWHWKIYVITNIDSLIVGVMFYDGIFWGGSGCFGVSHKMTWIFHFSDRIEAYLKAGYVIVLLF